MRRALRWLIPLVVVAAAAALFWHLSRPEAVPVMLARVERGPVESTVANTRVGTVEACRRSKLAPATGGQVSRLPVREGDRVEEGALLLEIWNEDLAAQARLAESEISTARAREQEACLEAQVAEREAKRLQRLREQELVSEERADRATTDARARFAGCEAARAALEVSRARVEVVRAELERTRLIAPFAGVVAEVNAELGEYVTPSPPGIATLPAVDLIDDGCLYVKAPIDEVDAPDIRPGMPACVTLDAFPGRLCGARVRRIAPYVLDREKQARTVDVEVDLRDARDSWNLLPGYSADVEIVLERREEVLRVPTEAVLDGHRVLVYADASGRLEERTIDTGLSNWRYTEVRAGLDAGERVVVSVTREGVEPGALAVPEGGDGARSR
ncbi:MAG: efflux RND transporter periplasmic adaptor subunit [Gammaproteobacteria bacterium]|nr:efflux RND transporter periplasmic adaptor subunit [Gammaproteobacteria bacterium]NIR85292.1 efflux RND transporter periplasmic adaptor subunit [Gammaproteobacteria bacterium]NIR88408.1 efflux RND transporter periplasmic adaptor subunit [Gammaproteobacteria bacterium]NIU06358.1 efflux RND transporter periplasmic adaptor subunit [Gammaproteobacteria bacterium]NIV53257.1 efflux RND transporter periplasmic adaptor subunit [Gammaproteobacteria bacterium]